jgi:hypothetical protein
VSVWAYAAPLPPLDPPGYAHRTLPLAMFDPIGSTRLPTPRSTDLGVLKPPSPSIQRKRRSPSRSTSKATPAEPSPQSTSDAATSHRDERVALRQPPTRSSPRTL